MHICWYVHASQTRASSPTWLTSILLPARLHASGKAGSRHALDFEDLNDSDGHHAQAAQPARAHRDDSGAAGSRPGASVWRDSGNGGGAALGGDKAQAAVVVGARAKADDGKRRVLMAYPEVRR